MATTDDGGAAPVQIGFTGVGSRGQQLMRRCIDMDDVAIPAVCDVQQRHLDAVTEQLEETGRPAPTTYDDHEEMLASEELDGVVIASSWRLHIPMAIEAMEAGVRPGLEVGPASSVQECWDLVRTAERTGQDCMLLENACFGREKLAAWNMVQQGLFGELVHCECGYFHDIRPEIHGERPTRMAEREGMGYRTLHFLHRNADVYPTHGVGPVAKYLGINRGNRFLSMTSTASKSVGLERWAKEHRDEDAPTRGRDWAIGDVVTSVVRCANGETIVIQHDCSSPRGRGRNFKVQGSNGLWISHRDGVHIEGRSPDHGWEPFEDYREEFDHPLWEAYDDYGVKSGHGGTDFLVMRAFTQSIAQDVRPPIDVYDTAAWMSITPLSEESIATGSNAVTFPDFTNGGWLTDDEIFGLTGDVPEDRLDFDTLL